MSAYIFSKIFQFPFESSILALTLNSIAICHIFVHATRNTRTDSQTIKCYGDILILTDKRRNTKQFIILHAGKWVFFVLVNIVHVVFGRIANLEPSSLTRNLGSSIWRICGTCTMLQLSSTM